MPRCCGRRPGTVVDKVSVNRAVTGNYAVLNPVEMKLAVAAYMDRGWGLAGIVQALGYNRSSVAEIMAEVRANQARRRGRS